MVEKAPPSQQNQHQLVTQKDVMQYLTGNQPDQYHRVTRKDVVDYLREPGTKSRRGFLLGMASDAFVIPAAAVTAIGVGEVVENDNKTAGVTEIIIGGGILLERGIVWWRSRGGRLDQQRNPLARK